ncbi:DUF6775 family putative metallopeptidase [Nitrososphaera sp.]|uniref:DUF6775 family putative metallopeptidase n=1 Tax=Nitrososphaera sp. TaxID=1971748 RepID=UPI00316FD684
MDFSRAHFYRTPSIDTERVASGVLEIFPKCKIDARKPVVLPAEQAMISDIAQPFHAQSKVQKDFDLYGKSVRLYDGFQLQQIFAQAIPEKEKSLDHLHIIFTDLLACTFSEDDWRYHARTVICGTPSIISVPGIVEAPAKPREFYFGLSFGLDAESAKKSVRGRFVDYGDERIVDAATNFALQAMFFFLTEGEPFCDDSTCRLFNAHWQEDLIRTLKNPALCRKHRQVADKFNGRLARM